MTEQAKKERPPRYPRTSRCKRYRYEDKGGLGQFKATCLDCQSRGVEHHAFFNKRDPLTLVRDHFLHDADTRALPCREMHIKPIKSHASIKWLKSYWAVRKGLEWSLSKKVRGPVAALKNVLGEEAGTDPVIAIGLDPKPMERPDSRFDELYEVVELGMKKEDADNDLDKLKSQANGERRKSELLARDIPMEIDAMCEEAKANKAKRRKCLADALLKDAGLSGALAKYLPDIVKGDAHVWATTKLQEAAQKIKLEAEEANTHLLEPAEILAARSTVAQIAERLMEVESPIPERRHSYYYSTEIPLKTYLYAGNYQIRAAAFCEVRKEIVAFIELWDKQIAAQVEMAKRKAAAMKPIEVENLD